MYVYMYNTLFRAHSRAAPARKPWARASSTRPLLAIFKLRISKFGVWVNRILTSRRWAFLAHRLFSWRSDFGILTQRFLV